MPVFQKANKLIALSAFALSATLFVAPSMRAATTDDVAVATVSTSADTAAAPTADATATPQAAAPAAAPAAPAAPATWSVGPIEFSGLIDGYYNWNNNHPNDTNSPTPTANQLRNFDFDANSFSLNMAKLSLSHTADPVGFRIDLGFGKAFSAFGLGVLPLNAPNGFPNGGSDSVNDTHLEQAYISWVPTKGKGFEADFGEFVTSAGAEVIETYSNINYSRGLLFTWMLPYYHFGLRTSYPLTKKETVGFQLVNGWNNITDNNAGKTIGVTSLYTASKYNWALNYYGGPENNIAAGASVTGLRGTDRGYRMLIDTTLNLTLSKLTGYINYDYSQNRNAAFAGAGKTRTTNLYRKQGVALAGRYQLTNTLALAGRYEYLVDGNDRRDFGGTSAQITGFRKATIQEFTITGEYKMAAGLLARLEYRRDHTDNPFFTKGLGTNFGGPPVKSQSTLELGITAFFGPKR